MPIVTENPVDELKDRHREIVTQTPSVPDEQEQAEREEAARAYAGENEQHFVDYCMDCIKTSTEARKEIRAAQDECWRIYNEDEPATYSKKAAWQSRIVVPKPFQSVQYGAAAIKKAFSPDFLSVEDEQNKQTAEFWKDLFKVHLNISHANFVLKFADAVTMGLAVGESLEMIPQYTPGLGLEFDLVEPWKIHRDPDCPARDPQGGLYWIHQEWIDYFVLQDGEQKGKYFDVARAQATEGGSGGNPNDPFMTPEAISDRKKQVWQRSRFRKMVQVNEFWGTVLSPNAEVILDRATYTVAGGRVIQKPVGVKYKNLRWPGVTFSPLPDILTSGGRGLLKGVRSIWEAMNNLMCLHEDALKWLVNPPTEINIDQLANPEDVEQWPGKKFLTISSLHGQQATRTQTRRDVTNTVLANMQYLDQNFQRGSFSTDGIQGLPGYRKDMTWRESSQNLQQALGVYALMGANIEMGAVMALMAAKDAVEAYAPYEDYVEALGEEKARTHGLRPPTQESKSVVDGLPPLGGSFHVSGIQALMQEAETLQNLMTTVIPLSESPRYAPYCDPWKICKALETRINLSDEAVFVDEAVAKKIKQGEDEAYARGQHITAQQQSLEMIRLAQATQAALTGAPPPGEGQ